MKSTTYIVEITNQKNFKLKFIEMMVNLLRLRIFLKTDTFKYLLSQHLVVLSRI